MWTKLCPLASPYKRFWCVRNVMQTRQCVFRRLDGFCLAGRPLHARHSRASVARRNASKSCTRSTHICRAQIEVHLNSRAHELSILKERRLHCMAWKPSDTFLHISLTESLLVCRLLSRKFIVAQKLLLRTTGTLRLSPGNSMTPCTKGLLKTLKAFGVTSQKSSTGRSR